MSIRNAGVFLRNLRNSKGLSQEEFSNGICTPISLSRIETGKTGLRPATLQKFLLRTGTPNIYFPAFRNQLEFETFHALQQALFYIDYWDLEHAYPLLLKAEAADYCQNPLLFQQGIFGKSLLQIRSGTCDFHTLSDWLQEAIQVTINLSDLKDISRLILSGTEIQLLIAWSRCAVSTGNSQEALPLLNQLSTYVQRSAITYNEKSTLQARINVVLAQIFYDRNEIAASLNTASSGIQLCLDAVEYTSLHELTFWEALCRYRLGECEKAYSLLENCYLSARSCESPYAVTVKKEAIKRMHLPANAYMLQLDDPIPRQYSFSHYTMPKTNSNMFLNSSLDDYPYRLGNIIHDVRVKQGLTQAELSAGLCSRSALTKIEYNALWPDKWLADALLQRLGLYSEMFAMYGSAKDVTLDELRNSILINIIKNQYDNADQKLQTFYNIMDKNNPLQMQFYYNIKSSLSRNNPISFLDNIQKALTYTTSKSLNEMSEKGFFSKTELDLLRKYAEHYAQVGQLAKSFQLLYNLQDYYSRKSYDPQEKSRTYPGIIHCLIRYLYRAKRFQEIINFSVESVASPLHDYYITGSIYFYTSQALGELHAPVDQIILYGKYAAANYRLLNIESNAKLIEKYLLEDFGIVLP